MRLLFSSLRRVKPGLMSSFIEMDSRIIALPSIRVAF